MERSTPIGRLVRRTRKFARGFTLVELMVVMLIIAVLAAIAIPAYVASIRAAREAVLREDLHVLRDAIDAYTNDKNKAPQALDDLVSGGYLKSIPVDPVTHSNSTWVPTMDDTLQSVDQTDPGRERRPALFHLVVNHFYPVYRLGSSDRSAAMVSVSPGLSSKAFL
jgi:general secretion pathway protein G